MIPINSLQKYLNQSAKFKEATGYGIHGEPTYSEEATIKVRKIYQQKKIRSVKGDELISTTTVWTRRKLDCTGKTEQFIDDMPILAAEEWRRKDGKVVGYIAYQ